MNNQEAFDTVVAHLRKQGRPSVFPSNALRGCAYRGADGLKCAAGCLIPDEMYSIHFECNTISGLLTSDARIYSRVNSDEVDYHKLVELTAPLREHLKDVDPELVRDLQMIHDFKRVELWEQEFRTLAERRELAYTPPGGSE